MAIIFPSVHGAEAPLLDDTVDGSVDFEGRPVHRSSSGVWRSAAFIIAVEVTERSAFHGVGTNLITYLTGPLGQSTATAADNVNAWTGTAALLPLLGAFVVDAYLGRYHTIIVASLVYILGLGMVIMSAILTSLGSSGCQNANIVATRSSPQVLAFGADQFDGQHIKERMIAKSSFFNWWYFGISIGSLLSILIIVYIEDYISWALGFGIVFILMAVGLVIFLLGRKTYRYGVKENDKNPFARSIGMVFVAAVRNWHFTTSSVIVTNEGEVHQTPLQHSSDQFRFLNKALHAPDCSGEARKQCSIKDVEDAKALLRLIPIWATCLVYAIVFAQASTFFTKQGVTMDRTISHGFKIPAASLQFFTSIAVTLFIPFYDSVFVPTARALTRKPSGITILQRIGTGIFLSAISMVVAALVEMKRLKTAQEYRLVDKPNTTVPMNVRWLVPQYLLFDVADVFTVVGMQEFFNDQVQHELRSMRLSFYLSVIGVGSILSSLIVSTIDKLSSADGGDSWFSSNIKRAHLHYFYWLLGGLSMVGLTAFVHFSRSFVYDKGWQLHLLIRFLHAFSWQCQINCKYQQEEYLN
ncbi:hypothetical protein SLEP1_g43510 [Rubroshorea leprosula]|uniref:Protein NRT1/ PTR FAMILY 5.10-like n=1 Tax=Rubroshorea leprosula TaxID=152421 RepID=A0AAV5LDQ1_9ROSI|nr:hypothetical protein SLEP1_g43510 [Rubroshorea leprosula]